MSTRAIVSFIDREGGYFNVYKHHDGYPEGILPLLGQACRYAWPLNRFEADEFTCAFITVAKPLKGGGVRLLPPGRWQDAAPYDVEFHYTVVQCESGHVAVMVEAVSYAGKRYGVEAFDETMVEHHGLKQLQAEWG